MPDRDSRNSNPLRMLREEVSPEHATRGELTEVKVAIGLVQADVNSVKEDVAHVKENVEAIRAAVLKPAKKDGDQPVSVFEALDRVPTKLEKTGTTGVLMLLVILTLARMLGLQLPSP